MFSVDKNEKLLKSLLKQKKVQSYLLDLKEHHKETYDHSLRVSLLAIKLGYENKLPKKQIKLLGYSGLFHDLGKLEIHPEILSNKKALEHHEKKIIQEHPRKAFLRLDKFKEGDVKKIIIQSHEYGKEPYPRKGVCRRKDNRKTKDRRKNNSQIERLVHILAIADMYDALINKRAYKKSFDKKNALKILEEEFRGDKSYLDQISEL